MKKTILSILALSLLATSCGDDDAVIVSGTPDEGGDGVTVVESGELDYTIGSKVDISGWDWKDATLSASKISLEAVTLEAVAVENTVLSGNQTTDRTLDGNYTLPGSYVIKSGVTLTIAAGTEIKAATADSDTDGSSIFIAVEAGGKININGTSADPVVMSSATGTRGDWGGLTIAGNAFTTAHDGTNAVTAEVSGITYGSSSSAKNTESSGSISYLVIRGTGAQIDSESQYNGISFFGVGSGTTVQYVAVINGGDDGVEFFGGSVAITNLYVENSADDAIDWTEGWSGGVTNAYISNTNEDFSTVIEADKDNYDPSLTNITAISTVGGTALQFKKASGATIKNLYLDGYDTEFDVKDADLFVPENVTIDGDTVETK